MAPTPTSLTPDRVARQLRRTACRRDVLLTAAVVLGLIHGSPWCMAQPAETEGPQQESARTSDGVDLAIWYYPSATEESLATVVLIHDLEGSHATLEPLALGFQAAGMSVVAPDLRGHGGSTERTWPNGQTDDLEAKRLRKPDFDAIVASQGGRVREQAQLRGDLETVYAWIRKTARSDSRLSPDRLCLVGSGLGGTLATLWAALDAAWPPLASGPQGGNVRAICLISPVFASKGASIGPALNTPIIARDLPLLILAGERDRDASRVFGQLKRGRADSWFEQKADGSSDKAKEVENPATDATLFLLSYATQESADDLARAGSQTFVPVLTDFFGKQLNR